LRVGLVLVLAAVVTSLAYHAKVIFERSIYTLVAIEQSAQSADCTAHAVGQDYTNGPTG